MIINSDFVNAITDAANVTLVEALFVGGLTVGFIVSECLCQLDKLAAQKKGWEQHRSRKIAGPRMSADIRNAYEREKRS